jgi:hypothetical protein
VRLVLLVKMSFFINLQNGNDTAKPPNASFSRAE